MAKFNFERNLPHQQKAVSSTVAVFDDIDVRQPQGTKRHMINPVFDTKTKIRYRDNIVKIQKQNGIKPDAEQGSNVLDILMETGTGKTYTYTQTMFELHKLYGVFKFVIVVPTLSIKAGTVDFLSSSSAREHFKELYSGAILSLHIVQSKKAKKGKKSIIPQAIKDFAETGSYEKNTIQVLIINAGMINSPTMADRQDKKKTPFEAIADTRPFMIIDEPHKFAKENTTWQNILNMKPQQILRYGATFPQKDIKRKDIFTGKTETIKKKDYQNLIYILSAVDSFANNLVKGVIGHITEFEDGQNITVRLISTDGVEAGFELTTSKIKKSYKVAKKQSMEKIDPAMSDLYIENLNKTTVMLSNGLSLKKGDKINPYSYSQTLQDTMIQKAIKNHFKIEQKFLTLETKIKPLTLFFIDNIHEYRDKEGHTRQTVEKYIKIEATNLLKTETNEFYRQYLEKTLSDVSATHGGYFSQDNSDKDEMIEKEVVEILHDKQAMLSLENPRRFVFSKWTLREGWDNPNIFQICKLRSSGSEISKLQEVGRGLRLPVNQYGHRVKHEQFYLNYFVDWTENDFIDKLINEINDKTGALSIDDVPDKLHENMIKLIYEKYHIAEDKLLETLDDKKLIKRTNEFLKGGFEYIKANYPKIFEGVDSNKIRMAKATGEKSKANIRKQKYPLLKELWEKLNQKVVLQYNIKDEKEFKKLFVDFLTNHTALCVAQLREKKIKVEIKDSQATAYEYVNITDDDIIAISTMRYDDFLRQLSSALYINPKTLHGCFVDTDTQIQRYLNQTTIIIFKQKFDDYLTYQAMTKFSIEYQNVRSQIHPTKLTHKDGMIKDEIMASSIGRHLSTEKVADSYIFEELFFDSNLEKENIKTNIESVVVFSKIPTNSIKIPISGGKSFSPDFAYVLKFGDGTKNINFIVETKDTDEQSLRDIEKQKIRHTEILFGGAVKIKFETQFKDEKISSMIKDIYDKKSS